MRVIAGSAKGAKLYAPDGKNTRPTTDRSKQKLFDTLNTLLSAQPTHVIDLFAGTGSLGIEALSRGAKSVTFVEKNRSAIHLIRKNLEKTHLIHRSKIVKADAFLYLQKKVNPKSQLILADPPYALGFSQKLVNLLSDTDQLDEDGIFVLEESSDVEINVPEKLYLVSKKKSGATTHYFFQKRSF